MNEPSDTARYAAVYLLDQPYAIDRAFDYRIPEDLLDDVCRGRFVTVPFGAGDRTRIGLVTAVSDTTSVPRVKPIFEVLSDGIRLDEELTDLCLWLAETTLSTVGDAVRAAVPSFALLSLTDYFRPVPDRPYHGSDKTLAAVYSAVVRAGVATARKLHGKTELPLSVGELTGACRRLVRGGYLTCTSEPDGKHGVAVRRVYRPALPMAALDALIRGETVNGVRLRSPAHKEILTRFRFAVRTDAAAGTEDGEGIEGIPEEEFTGGTASSSETETPWGGVAAEKGSPETEGDISSAGQVTPTEQTVKFPEPADRPAKTVPRYTRAQLKALVDKKILSLQEVPVFRDPILPAAKTPVKYELNDEQSAALGALLEMVKSGEAKAALLHGVTGSGKTCVMTGLLDTVLGAGGGAILLLPEISLTPQTLSIFCSRYGDRVAVIHSGLSQGERYDAYRRIRDGRATLVIGTRSAVFSPVRNLRLIILDEEQEHTYKSDRDPKYHARDVARFRCAKNKALLLLASATPTLETYKKAKEGTYALLTLTKRFRNVSLPEVRVADMRGEVSGQTVTPIGGDLLRELFRVRARGEQSLLFLNRRGFNRYVSCRSCGKPVLCPNCSVAMTYHTDPGTYERGHLVCHLCGARAPVPTVCPSCSSEHLARLGFGTQRIEKDLSDLLPDIKILRMDADSTSTKDAYGQMLGAFRRHEADVLLGTQMITKGHDFPDVTLVGVLNADASLFADDYRAAEHTFSLLTQVIGRAGRAGKPGLAVIQTSNPDAEVIRLAVTQDYERFYESEIRLRRELTFPPFCDMVLLTVTAEKERDVLAGAAEVRREFDRRTMEGGDYADVKHVVFGPFEAPVYRMDGKYRMRLVVKCVLNRRSRALFAELLRGSVNRNGTKAPGTRSADSRFGDKSTAATRNAGGEYTLSVDLSPSSL